MLDEGCEVSGIGMGSLTDLIDQDQIARIYEIWAITACFGKPTGGKLTLAD